MPAELPSVRRGLLRASPPAVTLAALGGLFGAAFALGVSASDGSPGSRELVASAPWVAWLLIGALALVVFAALFLLALRILRTGPDWGLAGPEHGLPAQVIPRLLLLWKLLVSCVTAFALAVAAAIVNSGALRVAFITAHPGRGGEFPPSNVLLYGAFFAVLLAAFIPQLGSG